MPTAEQKRGYSQKYYRANTAYHAEKAMNGRLRRKYGLTLDQFAAMEEMQDWQCAICDVPLLNPHVDHDHCTGRVRGLLCRCCNTGLGMFRDSCLALRQAIKYLGE